MLIEEFVDKYNKTNYINFDYEIESITYEDNDLYLTFGSNEEICGNAQYDIVQEFEKRGIKLEILLYNSGRL